MYWLNKRTEARLQVGDQGVMNPVAAEEKVECPLCAPFAATSRSVLIALPFVIVGGAESIVSEVAVHLRSLGCRITLTTTEAVDPACGDSTAWFRRSTDEIYHLPRFLQPDRWADFVCHLIASKRIDTVWLAGSPFIYKLLPVLKQRFPSLKVVDFLFNELGHTASNRKFAPWIDLNMVENSSVRRWLLEHGEHDERIATCTLGIDTDRYAPPADKEAAKAALGLEGKFVIGCSGRLSEEKCPEAAVLLAAELAADERMTVVMTGGGPLEPQIRALVTQLGLENRLRFYGLVPDILPYMHAYDVLVLPSRLDGRPTAVLQALSCGVPVIATSVGALPEIITPGVNGFLAPPVDLAAFVQYAKEMCSDCGRHEKMRENARAYALRELRNEVKLKDFVAAFERVWD